MTQKQRLEIYERFFHQVQLYHSVTLNESKVRDALDIISAWSYAHRVGNGKLDDIEQRIGVDSIVDLMDKYSKGG